MDYNFKKIESKWQKKWEQEKVFEPEVDKKKKKFFVSFPYPYINAYPHVGHLYTIARVDAFARYKRLNGFNVLFPQAWHVTGSPIVAAANRVKEKEEKQLKIMKDMGIKQSELKKFENPEYWIKFFSPEFKKDYIGMGLSIDWRRNFITSSLNPCYDKFIRWQFRKLKEKGLVGKGKHPVVWDSKTNMPVGDHDRIKGEGEVPQEFTLFKFKLDDGRMIMTATLRHDTLMGITNIYVDPEQCYKEVEAKDEKWIVGEPIIKKLKNQDYKVKIIGDVFGKDLVGQKVKNFSNKKILILPATFLDINYGTGIVHSVPSDSADDLIALRDFQNNDKLIKKYKLDLNEIKSIEPIAIFNTLGIKEGISSQYFLDKYKVKNQNERNKLEKIKKELYKLTFSKSTFNSLYSKNFSKDLEGKLIPEGQKVIKKDLLKKGAIEIFYELTGEVISRSLAKCVVKIVGDQWFINYGDKRWKKKTHEALDQIQLYPEKVRDQFRYVIDWLRDWACTREYGLGTRLPFDENWIIESLSDSTIYMAYYTIANLIKDFKLEDVNDALFDYVFLGKGKGKKQWESLKKEFEYWYPLDFRNSGKDLVQNHLTFFIFNHVAIFPKKYWPKSIGVNGWVKVDGEKMSKSLGNMILLREVAGKLGADVVRITILSGGENMEDPNWDSNFAQMIQSRLISLYKFSISSYNHGKKEKNNNDKWMESQLNKIVRDTNEFVEKTLFRSAIQRCYFDLQNSLKRYLQKEEKPNVGVLNNVIETQLILLSPFAPHICEEIWNKIGKKGFISMKNWPKVDESKINEKLEQNENIIEAMKKDTLHVINLSKEKSPYTYYYCIPKDIDLFKENERFLKEATGSKAINIYSVKDIKSNVHLDPQGKAKKAKPGKPGIYISGTSLEI